MAATGGPKPNQLLFTAAKKKYNYEQLTVHSYDTPARSFVRLSIRKTCLKRSV